MKELEIEKAIRIVSKYFDWNTEMIKPTLLHSIKVWVYLYSKWYSQDICIGWFLHDTLEDTNITEQEILSLFWENVLDIVKANTKDKNIDKSLVNSELIERCWNLSEDALIVKSADIIDNYIYYSSINSEKWVNRCIELSWLVIKNKKIDYLDPIFNTIILINQWKFYE